MRIEDITDLVLNLKGLYSRPLRIRAGLSGLPAEDGVIGSRSPTSSSPVWPFFRRGPVALPFSLDGISPAAARRGQRAEMCSGLMISIDSSVG